MAPKTAVSLPRKLNNSYAHNLTGIQGVNPAILANSKGKQNRIQSQAMNLNVSQNSNVKNLPQNYTSDEATLKKQINFMNIHQPQTFLPFTGVDQPFMMHRPQFSRVAPLISEKINDMTSQNVTHALNSVNNSTVLNNLSFKSAKGKLVYDSTYLQNIEMGEQDCRMLVPQVFRKQNGAHISERPAKYFKNVPKQMIERDKENPVWATNILVFESRFESGNLGKAYQVSENVYDLELRSDFGSVNPLLTQWFFFRVKNIKANVEYTFNIVNLFKPDSSYNQGMKPLVYSEKQKIQKGHGWFRDGYDIRYYPTQHRVKKMGNDQQYYTLSFKLKFTSENDTVYLSHCFPYTYSDLVRFLNENCNIFSMKDRLKRTQMCRTIAGNSVEMLIITNLESSQDDIAERSAIIVSSRVHPGESNASFIVEGFIQFMMSDDEEAHALRERYVFKIIPMLNPDGVIVGNYRSSLGGYDLNRQWQNPSMKVSPEIFCMKEMIKKTLECRKIDLFVDIHGHSRQKNLFIYGCSKLQGGPHTQSTLPHPGSVKKDKLSDLVKNIGSNGNAANTPMFSGIALQNLTTKEKVFPWLYHKNCENFSYHSCLFGVHKSKESTGRAVVWREFGIQNSYTLECSFCGPTQGGLRDCHFTIESLLEMGVLFAKTILDFSGNKIQKVCQGQIESFYKQGGGYIYHGLGHDKKQKKSEKELSKKIKRMDGNQILSRQKTPLLKQNSMISPHPNAGPSGMNLTSNGSYGAVQHHQVQSVMNKQKKSVQLDTISVKKSEDRQRLMNNERNVSTAEGKMGKPQGTVDKVRESSVHVFLKQHSKSGLLAGNNSKEKLRDRSQRQQSTTQRAINVHESNSVRIQESQDERDLAEMDHDVDKRTFKNLTPKQNNKFNSNLTSMHLIMSEEDPNISERQSNSSPKADQIIKRFHSQQANKMLQFNQAKHRIMVKDKHDENPMDKLDGFGQSQVALPKEQYSNRHSQKNLLAETQLINQAPYHNNNEQNNIESKDNTQAQARVNLKGSIHQFSRKQKTLTTESRNPSNAVAQEENSQTRKLANSEHQYFNNPQNNKKSLHGINMSALSKLRVSLAQNVNVAEQILTRDFKKSSVLNDQSDRHLKIHQIAETPMHHQNGLLNSKGGEQSRNLKSGISSKKGGKKDKKNQRILKMGEQFSGKKLSTKSSLQIQQAQIQGHMIQHQQTNQILQTHSQLMKTSGFHSKKQNSGASSSTLKERMMLEGKRTEDERAFVRGIMAVGSEKHLKYNNLKKQLQKQKDERLISNKSSSNGMNVAGGGSTLGNTTGKRQNREHMIEKFTNVIQEVIHQDNNGMQKKSQASDYSPLYKDYQRAGDLSSGGGKKQKKSGIKDYTSEENSKRDIAGAGVAGVNKGDTLTSLDDFQTSHKKKMINQNNLSPQPSLQSQSKRLRAHKQQLLLLSDKKSAGVMGGTASRAAQGESPYKQKRLKAQSDDKYGVEIADDNSNMQEENVPQRPGPSELTFTSFKESNNDKVLFHKSIELKHKTNGGMGASGRIAGQSQQL